MAFDGADAVSSLNMGPAEALAERLSTVATPQFKCGTSGSLWTRSLIAVSLFFLLCVGCRSEPHEETVGVTKSRLLAALESQAGGPDDASKSASSTYKAPDAGVGSDGASRDQSWSAESFATSWTRRASGEYVEWTSPQLQTTDVEEIHAIVLEMHSTAHDTHQVELGWGSTPQLSPADKTRNRRQFPVGPSDDSQTFVLRGEDISSNWQQTQTEETPQIRYLFLRWRRSADSSIEVHRVRVGTREALYDGAHWGRYRDVTDGRVADVVYQKPAVTLRAPLEVTNADDELRMAVRLTRGTRARLQLRTIDDASGSDRVVFDDTVDRDQEWKEIRVRLDHALSSDAIQLHLKGDSAAVLLIANARLVHRRSRSNYPNVILYMVDTLRADHLGLYGYPRDTSPTLDHLGENGVVFDRSYATTSWTKPSVVSLLTSLHPLTHRVGASLYADTLPEGTPTLQQQLRNHGYVTASFVANPLGTTLSNLDQDFDEAYTPNAFDVTAPDSKQHQIHSDDINDLLLPWIDTHESEAFFLFVHSLDPHRPYATPFGNDEDDKDTSPVSRYDEEIRFNDAQIGRLLDHLKKRQLLRDTLVVVTSDHGEAFGEHGTHGHGQTVYEEELRVPLIYYWPSRLTSRRIERPIQLVDVAPTILKLLPAVEAGSEFPGRGVDLESSGQRVVDSSRLILSRFTFPAPFVERDLFAVVKGTWKLIHDRSKGSHKSKAMLFDLSNDGAEMKDLSDAQPAEVRELAASLDQYLDEQKRLREEFRHRIGSRRGQPSFSDIDALHQLRNLGYMSGP